MDTQLQKNLSNSRQWLRAVYVFLFIFVAKFSVILVAIIAALQVIFCLFSGQPNERLVKFGDSLAKFLCAIYLFALHRSEHKPFPFDDWPEGHGSLEEGSVINSAVVEEQSTEVDGLNDELDEAVSKDDDKAGGNNKIDGDTQPDVQEKELSCKGDTEGAEGNDSEAEPPKKR